MIPGGAVSSASQRSPVSQLKRWRRAAIQSEFPGNGDEFVPEPPLRGGQHIEPWDEMGRQCRLVIPTRSTIRLRAKPKIADSKLAPSRS